MRKVVLESTILQNNTHNHTSSQALASIQNSGFKLIQHPPYFPDLAPSDYYLFPKLKESIKGCKVADDEKGKWTAGRARPTILLQTNLSFGEMLDQVHFSCMRLC